MVSTDQKSLKELLQQRVITGAQQNWAAKLLGYDFEIVYKPGKLNRGADALSRIHEGMQVRAMCFYPKWEEHHQVQEEVLQDPRLQQIIRELQEDPNSHPEFNF